MTGITVGMSAETVFSVMNKKLEAVGFIPKNGTNVRAEDLCDIVEGYIGQGFSLSSDTELGKYVGYPNSGHNY